MKFKALPTQEQLSEILRYYPKTGKFYELRGKKKLLGNEIGNIQYKNRDLLKEPRLVITVDGVKYYAHRLAWVIMTGVEPVALVDHKNGNPLDNRWTNLRAATHGQNNSNRKKTKANTTGYKGVSLDKQGFIRASITYNKKTYYLGRYDTMKEAHAAYSEAAIALHGEFARVS